MSLVNLCLPRRLAAAFALSLTWAATLVAQAGPTGTVRGRVTESGTGRPLATVQVTVTGTRLGGVTNAAGEYTITLVPAGTHEVAARRLGYARSTRSVTVTAGSEARADFALSMSTTTLDAVVVTGTGGAPVERRTLGNSITQLDVADLTQKQMVTNVNEVLQGKTPGVAILPGSGAPGTAGEIRIRGASSVSGYKPVVFIDGIRYSIDDLGNFGATGGGTIGLAQSQQATSALNGLDPNDIESIEVIKGPAAATLYGAEAANGVIQIITKKGTRGQQALRWGVKAERGVNQWKLLPPDNYTTCDAAKQAQRVSPTDTTHVWTKCADVPVNTVVTDNPFVRDPNAIRDGQLARLGLSVRGGGDRYSFYMAGDRDTEQGTFYNSDNGRTSVRSNFGFNPTDKSDFAVNLNWNNSRLRLPIQDESANGLLLSAVRGQPYRLRPAGSEGWNILNPTQANRYQNYTATDRLTLGATLNVKPFTWFANRLTAGFDNQATQAQVLFLPGDIDATQDPDAAKGANLRRNPSRRVLTLDYAGTLTYDVRPSLLSTTIIGSQVVSDKSQSLSATGIGIGAPDVTLVGSLQTTTGSEAFSENNSVGYFIQEQLGWNNRLFATAAVRADDHSSFGTNFNMIIFPKFSLSYVVSEEPAAKGMLDAAHINSLKLRTAWGQAGRAPLAYSAPQTYTTTTVTTGVLNGSALRTNAYGNAELKPERGEELELGFDLGALDDRIGVDFTFYNKKITDMLQSTTVAPSSGFISSQLVNLGSVRNRGLEVGVFGTPVQRTNVTWETRVNYAHNDNELLDFGLPGKILETPAGQPYATVQQHRVGYPLGGYWVIPPLRCGIDALAANAATTGANACTAQITGAAQLTAAGAAIFNTGDSARRYVGPSTAPTQIGFSNTVTLFRNFRLYGLIDVQRGGYTFNYQERNRCQGSENCLRMNIVSTRIPTTPEDTIRFREMQVYRNASPSPEWIQKTDFVKLRELSLSVSVPPALAARAGAQSATVVLSGRNLKIWSDYEGVDPEVNSYGGRNFVRVDAYAAPMQRRLALAFNLEY